MKALSLWQPWASLWCSPCKVHETRSWSTRHRGWLLVHAAKKFVKDIEPGERLRDVLDDEFGGHWAMDLPIGAIIGMVDVVACQPTELIFQEQLADRRPWTKEALDDYECGDFGPGRFAFARDKFVVFRQPIPYRGMQGFFNVPDELLPHMQRAA
jgi:hypothetical protein